MLQGRETELPPGKDTTLSAAPELPMVPAIPLWAADVKGSSERLIPGAFSLMCFT